MFASGLKVGAHGDERLEVVVAAEGTADLVMDFHHAHRTFREVVREGDAGVGEASQDLVFFVVETLREVVRIALPCQPAAGATPSWRCNICVTNQGSGTVSKIKV